MTVRRSRLKSDLPKTPTLPLSLGEAAPTQPDVEREAAEEEVKGRTNWARRSTARRTMTSKRRIQRRVTPLEALQMPIQAGVRKIFDLRRFLLVLGLTVGVLLLPTPPGLSLEGHRALALFVFTGSILALEPAPLPIAALMVPICQIALGIDDASGAFAPFGQPVVFLILGSLFLAEALRKHGLTRRLALYTVVASKGQFQWLLLGLMSITCGLSMWVLNTATAAMLIPVAMTIAQRVSQQEHARRALTALILGIAISSSVGGIATIMGSGENAIASGLLSMEGSFGFLDWLSYGLPVMLVLLPMSWFLLTVVVPISNITIDTRPAMVELVRLGALKGPEREILVVLGASVALWVTGKAIEDALHLPPTLLSSAVVAIGAVAVLSIEEIIDWNDLKGVNWGVFFVIGAGLTLGDAMDKTGASEWFADLLSPLLMGQSYGAILGALLLLAFVLTQFMNNVTLGAILAPILITLGSASGIEPARLVVPTMMTLSLAYMLPVSSARMVLVAVTGAVERRDMIRTGFIVGVPCMLFIYGFFYVVARLGLI